MARYIELDALVAEIEKKRDSFYSLSESCEKGNPAKAGFCAQAQTLEGILSFLDTLEVKEIDFEAEWKKYFEYRGEVATVNVKHLAKHFFELGIAVNNKARKGE